jgi:hypothetical protein
MLSPGMVVSTFTPSTQEQAGGLAVPGQTGLVRLCLKKKGLFLQLYHREDEEI